MDSRLLLGVLAGVTGLALRPSRGSLTKLGDGKKN